jgi:hypothetical protein
MAHLRTLPGLSDSGFDGDRSLLVLAVGQSTNIYLVAGDGLTVDARLRSVATIDESSQLSKSETLHPSLTGWEKQQTIRKYVAKGVSVGTTTIDGLGADKKPGIAPLEVEVVGNTDYCQADLAGGATGSLTTDLAAIGLREAAIRVAEDQMNSKIGRTAHGGKGRYTNAEYDWCGAFAHWCYDKAAAIKGETNPFGTNRDVLLSPQKAITWVTFNQDKAMLIGYAGPGILVDDKAGTRTKEAKAKALNTMIAMNGNFELVERGDICLVRDATGTWRHVCIVYTAPGWGDSFKSIDGNQGYPSIKINDRTQKIHSFGPQYVFVHLTGI